MNIEKAPPVSSIDQDPTLRAGSQSGNRPWGSLAVAAAISAAAIFGTSGKSADAGFQGQGALSNGDILSVDSEEHGGRIILTSLSVAGQNGPGYLSAAGVIEVGDPFASLNYKHIGAATNAAFVKTDSDGGFEVLLGGSSDREAHVIVDSVTAFSPKAPLTLLPQPARVADIRGGSGTIEKDSEARFFVGEEYAGKTGFFNLAVLNQERGFHAGYACEDGYNGTSSINASGDGVDSTLTAFGIDSEGYACVYSSVPAKGIVVDFVGFTDAELPEAERVFDSREQGGRLPGNEQEQSIAVGKPNTTYILNVAAAAANGPGWLAVYSGEYSGIATLNQDGKTARAGFVIVETDETGSVNARSSTQMDLVIDAIEAEGFNGFIYNGAGRLEDTRPEDVQPTQPPEPFLNPNEVLCGPFDGYHRLANILTSSGAFVTGYVCWE